MVAFAQSDCKQQRDTNAARRWPEHKTSVEKQQSWERECTGCRRSDLLPDTAKVSLGFQVCGGNHEGKSIKHVLIWQMNVVQRRRRNQTANSHLSFILPSCPFPVLPWCHFSLDVHSMEVAMSASFMLDKGRPGFSSHKANFDLCLNK